MDLRWPTYKEVKKEGEGEREGGTGIRLVLPDIFKPQLTTDCYHAQFL